MIRDYEKAFETGKNMDSSEVDALMAGRVKMNVLNKCRLPGDIRIERDNFSIYIPIVSMLIISIVLSVIIYFLRR